MKEETFTLILVHICTNTNTLNANGVESSSGIELKELLSFATEEFCLIFNGKL